MAKISKKSSGPLPGAEIENIKQFIFEGLEDAGFFTRPEPITQIPNIDMYSTQTELVVEVEMPGVRKEDIEVSMARNILYIKALKFECFEEEKINYVCMERAFGRIFRSIEIPYPVDTVKIKAVYRNGILTIAIPRVEDKRCLTKKIPIDSI